MVEPIVSLVGQHAPDAPIAFGRDRVTRAEQTCAHVAGVATLLGRADPGEQIVVMCRDRYRFAVALLAAWQQGYSVALPPSAQLEAVAEVRRRPGVRTVVHDVDGIDRGIDVRAADVVEAARAGSAPFAPFDYPADRRLATVYTSGSTGANVECAKTAGQLIGEAKMLARAFALGGARFVPMVPAHHIYGLLFGVLVPMASGGSFCRETPLHPSELAAMVRADDVLVTVPAHLRALASARDLPSVGRVFSSGAPLPPDLASQLKSQFAWSPIEVLGSSETGGIAWRDTLGRGAWRPLPGVSVHEGSDHTIEIDSPFLHPSEARPYRGADRIEMQPDGTFLHLGRTDGVWKVGGVRVSLAEVEERLLAIAGVRDAAAMAVDVDGPRGVEVWAAVVAPGLTSVALREALVRYLAPVAVPRRIKLVDALPREANGKLPRRALEAIFRSGR